jgi:hypothetical protein
MTRRTTIGERRRGSRIDDLGTTHISVFPEIDVSKMTTAGGCGRQLRAHTTCG